MRYLLCALALLSSPLVLADWQLDGDSSRISFVSVKRGEMAEVMRFDRLSGQIDDKGEARILIPMESIDSGLALRDERLRQNFFDVAKHPQATISSQLDLSSFDDLQVGQSRTQQVDLNLELNGQQRRLKADVLVSRLDEGRVQVAMLEPLAELASLPSITPEVPVFAVLGFRQVVTQQP
ncbi:YceI family protein [Pseudomonas jinjuensis]|uniref:Polyisoprenoid-binding protein YceI n=1 Tax=Pseudomonas jinjuensis TaxID=198616 RepID=A0A1H0Q1B7_9PSED|nr:YceI family protein [Pseudomonas jinjuensis]SDP11163.1 Polyisoprenoid-binding protein YceI [Pseudomonas jinjuensis]